MRDALSSLTTRGRTFLAAGTTTVVCGLVLGQWAMIQLGLLAALVPLCAAATVGRAPTRLTLHREVTPRLVTAGQSAAVRLHLEHDGRLPSGTLLLEEVVPYALGERPRFVVDDARGAWQRDLTYTVRPEVRGHHVVGPLTMRVTDPFGMVELGRTFHTTAPLVATPRTYSLSGQGPARAWAGSGHSRPRSFSVGQAEDVTVRDYQQGDDVRRIHWPSSARTGELMVRREEQPWQARTVIVLDSRSGAHRGRGAASSFETAVSITASLALHLTDAGHELQVATAAGLLPLPPTSDQPFGARIADVLEQLAGVGLDPFERLDTTWVREVPNGTRVVAVLGAAASEDREALARIERLDPAPSALVLDVDAWHSGRAREGAAGDPSSRVRVLTGHRWRAASLGPRDDLDAIWQQVCR
ncbi:DUF58 domain-containing protein [Nocardioides sp. Y6]|uniref:DUF58 domain-containing protein n=1 Tax=Nocardioides malaquae TaxID=2773426 RepID=A0ABR9RP04_9ACTN|nr:DUF58 domain-containing protein [Nocardioides malaquae]MBE7323238.1 DUF58 domain-containing protein [Nocardioides malaquae]